MGDKKGVPAHDVAQKSQDPATMFPSASIQDQPSSQTAPEGGQAHVTANIKQVKPKPATMVTAAQPPADMANVASSVKDPAARVVYMQSGTVDVQNSMIDKEHEQDHTKQRQDAPSQNMEMYAHVQQYAGNSQQVPGGQNIIPTSNAMLSGVQGNQPVNISGEDAGNQVAASSKSNQAQQMVNIVGQQTTPQIKIPVPMGAPSRQNSTQSRHKKSAAVTVSQGNQAAQVSTPKPQQQPNTDPQSQVAMDYAWQQRASTQQISSSSQPHHRQQPQMTNAQYLAQQQQQQQQQQQHQQQQQQQNFQRQPQQQLKANAMMMQNNPQSTSIMQDQQQQLRSFQNQHQQQQAAAAAAHTSQQQLAIAQQQHQQEHNSKMIEANVRSRIYQFLTEKTQYLQSADKAHAESLAKEIKKEEFKFFLRMDEKRQNKHSLLEQKNQRMDEYIAFCAENGGRVIPKQPEPLAPPHEAPVIVEMRLMHMDFVEESYWKRLQASRLAKECQAVAIRKAKQRALRLKEEKLQREPLERQAEPKVSEVTKGILDNPTKEIGEELGGNTSAFKNDIIAPDNIIDNNQPLEAPLFPPDGLVSFPVMDGDHGFEAEFQGGNDFLDPPLDLMSGLEMMDHDQPIAFPDEPDDGMHQYDQNNHEIHYDLPMEDDHDDLDHFDPDEDLRRQEALLEQQRIEENKKREEENLHRIEKIEEHQKQQLSIEPNLLDNPMNVKLEMQSFRNSYESQLLCTPSKRVQNQVFDDEESEDIVDAIEELKDRILSLDMTYLQPDHKLLEQTRVQQLKPLVQEQQDVQMESARQASDEDDQVVKKNLAKSTQQAKQDKNKALKFAKSAICQKFDKLGQLLVDQKMSPAEIIHTEQFSEALNYHRQALQQQSKPESDPLNPSRQDLGEMNEALLGLVLGEKQVEIHEIPQIDDYQFDSDRDAVGESDNESADEDKRMQIDIDGFFNEVQASELKEVKVPNDHDKTKLRPPSVLGEEQQRLYSELREINKLAPERNDLLHMEHLCQLWHQNELDWIQDKKMLKEFLENSINDIDGAEDKAKFQTQINRYTVHIETRSKQLEKFRRQPQELHKEKYMLTGSDQPQQHNQHQPQLAPQEFSFIKWYYGLFPDQWRLISDIVNYHPLTRGALHAKEFMAKEYFRRLDSNHQDLLQGRQKIQMQPWRETKLPWLINGRESCLMNSMIYLNRSHLQSINVINVLSRRQSRQKRVVYRFQRNEQGCLSLAKIGDSADAQMGELTSELAGKKRTRSDLDTEDHYSDEDEEFCDRHGLEVDIHDRLLNQMLARRRKAEYEETVALQRGILPHKDIYKEKVFLKELMIDITYKRQRTEEKGAQQIAQFTALAYDPVKVDKDELDKFTPMWYALQNMNQCQMTIRVQYSTMFWLGYFIRRIMHEENLEKLLKIQEERLSHWESENEIKNYFINQSQKILTDQLAQTKPDYQANLAKQEREQKEQLQRAFQHYFEKSQSQTDTVRTEVIKEVNDLWESKQPPYKYVPEQKLEYLKLEKENDQRISYVMYQKSQQLWDELQFYWFQVNSNLHPRYRKEQAINSAGTGDQQNVIAAQLRQLGANQVMQNMQVPMQRSISISMNQPQQQQSQQMQSGNTAMNIRQSQPPQMNNLMASQQNQNFSQMHRQQHQFSQNQPQSSQQPPQSMGQMSRQSSQYSMNMAGAQLASTQGAPSSSVMSQMPSQSQSQQQQVIFQSTPVQNRTPTASQVQAAQHQRRQQQQQQFPPSDYAMNQTMQVNQGVNLPTSSQNTQPPNASQPNLNQQQQQP